MLFHTIATLACLSGTVLALNCTDWQGKPVSHGEEFYPKKEDLCYVCRCDMGYQTMCMTVSCSPPNCQNWEQVEGQCCKFKCLDTAGPIDPEIHRPNYTGDSPGGGSGGTTVLTSDNLTDLGLRLVASTVTTFLILALLLFLIHRLRQRRLLLALRRYSRRQERLDDVDSVSCTPDIYGLEYSSYMDPPPPYSPPKPPSIAPGEQPPPYEMVISSSQNNQDTTLPNFTPVSEFQNHCPSRHSSDVANNNLTPAQEVDASDRNPTNGERMLRLRNERNQNRLESRPSGSDANLTSNQNGFDRASEMPVVLSDFENRGISNRETFHGSDSSLNMITVQGENVKYMPRMSQSWAFGRSDALQESVLSCSAFSSGYTRTGPVNGHIPQTLHPEHAEHLPSHDLAIGTYVSSSESATTNTFSIDRNNNSNSHVPARIVYADSLTSGQHTRGFAGAIRPGTMTTLMYPLAMSESSYSGTVSRDLDDCSNFTVSTAGDTSNQTDVENVGAMRRQETLRQLRLSHLLSSPVLTFDSPVSPLSLSPNDYPIQRSVSVTSNVSMFSVCSETGEKRQASHCGNIISNDVPYPTNSYRSFLKSALNGQQTKIRTEDTIDKTVSDTQNFSLTPTGSQSQASDTTQLEQQAGNQSSEISDCVHENSHQSVNNSIKSGSESSTQYLSHCASAIACPSIEGAFMPQDISHGALSKPGDISNDFPDSKSYHKGKINRFSTGSLPLPKGPKLPIFTHMSSQSGCKRSPRAKRSSSKSKDKVSVNDKKKTKHTDLTSVHLTRPCECIDSCKEYGLFDDPGSELAAKVVQNSRTNNKLEDLKSPSTSYGPVLALNDAQFAKGHHTYSLSVGSGQECFGLLDGSHANCHHSNCRHSNSHKSSKSLEKGDMSVKTVPDDHGHQSASVKSWGKSSHSSKKSKIHQSFTGARLFHEELESVLGKRRTAVLSSKSRNKKQNPKNGINFFGCSPSEFSHKEEDIMENTCSYV